jgi:hypothetical protein
MFAECKRLHNNNADKYMQAISLNFFSQRRIFFLSRRHSESTELIFLTPRRNGKILFLLFGHSEICDQSFSNRKGAKKKLINFLVWPFKKHVASKTPVFGVSKYAG